MTYERKYMDDKNLTNPLEELFTDASSNIDPAELLALLKPFIAINRENKKVIFTPSGLTVSATKKIILFLLSKKVLKLLSLIEQESVSPSEMKDEFSRNMPSGTIDSTLKRLSDSGLVQGEEGKYFVPDFNFVKIKELFYGKK